MTESTSLSALSAGLDEVRALRTHYFVPRGAIPSGTAAAAARAHGRACVVLLSSHWERYLRALNEEAIEWLNLQRVPLTTFPESILLLHSRSVVDELAERAWDRRAEALKDFARTESLLWQNSAHTGTLEHKRLLSWMKAPHMKSVDRYFSQFGVLDVASRVTRTPHTRNDLWLTIQELVDKRNSIAHGDATVEALPSDITRYLTAVSKFARSLDSLMSRTLRKLAGGVARPW